MLCTALQINLTMGSLLFNGAFITNSSVYRCHQQRGQKKCQFIGSLACAGRSQRPACVMSCVTYSTLSPPSAARPRAPPRGRGTGGGVPEPVSGAGDPPCMPAQGHILPIFTLCKRPLPLKGPSHPAALCPRLSPLCGP